VQLEKYYATAWWKNRSRVYRKVADGKCEECGAQEDLHVHHKRYKFFRERDCDLELLCATCHLKGRHERKDEMDMLDLNHRGSNDRLNYLIDQALEVENATQKPRDYLGGSRLGEECQRALQYEFFNVSKDKPFTGQTLRTFAIGHALENMAADWLRKAGLDLRTQKPDGYQFGFVTAQGKIRGHIDGVIVGGPEEFGPYPRLWECKTCKATKWREFVKSKVKKANQTYYVQVQLYQAYMELDENPALWTAINKDTSELYHEDIPFDPSAAQDASDRGVRIVEACMSGELLPRIAQDASHFRCKWCAWSDRCWMT